MRLVLALCAVFALAACSKDDNPKVDQAGADLSDAAQSTGSAVNNLAGAAADSAKSGAAKAETATGTAMEKAGASVKAQGQK